MAALTGMLESVGVTGEETLRVILQFSLPKKEKAYAKKLLRAGFEAALTEDLKAQPEPTEAQIAQVMHTMEALEKSPSQIRRFLLTKGKELPHDVGGPPKKLPTVSQEKVACAEVFALHGDLTHREAIHLVALRHKMSDRTMYRIWLKHNPKRKK